MFTKYLSFLLEYLCLIYASDAIIFWRTGKGNRYLELRRFLLTSQAYAQETVTYISRCNALRNIFYIENDQNIIPYLMEIWLISKQKYSLLMN
jgi:hypothetical protein